MIDIKYYTRLLLNDESEKLVMQFYANKKFKSLSSAQWFFAGITEATLSWVKEDYTKSRLLEAVKFFANSLKSEQMSLEDKISMVLDKCDKDMEELSFLDIRGGTGSRSIVCMCPKCKLPKSAWIPVNGQAKAVKCNHRTSCGFYGDFIAVYAEEYDLAYGKAMNILAETLNVDFTINEVHAGERSEYKSIQKPIALVPKKAHEVKYMGFDADKKYRAVRFEDYLDVYSEMSDEQQFKMLTTAIYHFSLTTKQWGKEKYYENVGISMKANPILKEKINSMKHNLGYLFKTDIPVLIEQMTKLFGKEDLVKYGLIHGELNDDGKPHYYAHQFTNEVIEGLVVVPNFDLYTNMCTGLKFRKTKLSTRFDKKKGKRVPDKNKEPEFSYGRIANPLPHGLTREALLDKSILFRLQEGQKDSHSIPLKYGTCDLAIPGTNGISEEMLGLFNGRIVEIYYDQDDEGQKAALAIKAKLEKAGATVTIIQWNKDFGGDLNDVLNNGHILKVI